jgi:excinuclease ABC subunit C
MNQNKAVGKPGKRATGAEKPDTDKIARLKALVRQAPEEAGVYIMRDADARIIYVGKAKVLRNRLSSYFTGRKDVKTRHLVSRVETIEWILAGSEYEALLLENNLIKEHTPKYNINLKDGKTYPSIRVTNEPFPRVFRTRRIINDGSLYFGPFPSAETIDVYLDLVKRLFPLRRCQTMRQRTEPCMYYHIGRCSAPCAGRISEADYAVHVDEVKKLLSGDTEALLADLRARMDAAALALRFEEAARLRDAVSAIELFAGRMSAVDFDPEARDYVAWAADGDLIVFVVFQMRGGKLTGRDLFRTRIYASEQEALAAFLMSYYGPDRLPPPLVYVQETKARPGAGPEVESKVEAKVEARTKVEGDRVTPMPGAVALPVEAYPDAVAAERPAAVYADSGGGPPGQTAPDATPTNAEASSPGMATPGDELGLVAEYFERELHSPARFALPEERRHQAAVGLARQNAREELAKRRREIGDIPALEELKAALGLASLPERIEGFDIAHLSGKHTVASLVSFKNGVPDKKNYRYFKIKSLDGAVDDFASIREAVARRYTRLVNEEAELPDLVLVDGGAGQVSAAREILEALGVDADLAGLAKRDEEIWLPDRHEPVVLPKDSPALRVLVAVRNETHRFATGLNQRLRASDLKFGILEEVEGVGEARSKRLMRVFGSLDLIASADPARVAEAGGISLELARRVMEAARKALDGRPEG